MGPFTIAICVCSYFSTALIAPFFYYVWQWTKSKGSRRLAYLVGNLGCCGIIGSLFGIIFYLDDGFLMKSLCSLNSFTRTLCIDVLSLTVLATNFERRKAFKKIRSHPSIFGIVLLIWLIAALATIPTWFTTVYDKNSKSCVERIILDNPTIGMVYEVARCIIFHVAVPGVIVYERFKKRAESRYFFQRSPTNTATMMKKIQRIQFLYTNSFLFVLVWLPLGISLSCYKLFRTASSQPDSSTTNQQQGMAYYIIGILFYLYVLIFPIIVYWTREMFHSQTRTQTLRSPQRGRCRGTPIPPPDLARDPPEIIVTQEQEVVVENIASNCDDMATGSVGTSMEMIELGKVNGVQVQVDMKVEHDLVKVETDVTILNKTFMNGRRETLI